MKYKRTNKIQIIIIIKKIIKREIIMSGFFIIYYIIITNLITLGLTDESEESKYFNITLKINKIGNISIFYGGNEQNMCNEILLPDIVEINGINQSIITNYYYFNRTENIIKLKWENKLNNTNCLFYKCFDIIDIDLSQFDLSKVTSMDYMFYGCSSLISLTFPNINISQPTSMNYMFFACHSLISLDLSSFNTSKAKSMDHMFSECYSLTSLDVNHFDTTQVTSMWATFHGLSSITSLNISNFDISKITMMSAMFSESHKLALLDISNFNTSGVTLMNYVFKGCYSLTSLDLSHFDTSSVNSMEGMFIDCSSLVSLNLTNFEFPNVLDMSRMFYGCSKLKYLNIENIKTKNDTRIYNIFSFTLHDLIVYCNDERLNYLLINYIPLYIYCYNDIIIPNYKVKYYEENINISDEDITNTIYQICGVNNDRVNISILYNDSYASIYLSQEIFINEENENEINKTEKIRNIIETLININDKTYIDNGLDIEIEKFNILTTLTTTYSQKLNANKNKTTIDLGECEKLLKINYNISFNNSLYIIKIDIREEGMKVPKIEYEVYYPLYDENLIKLNLTICKDSKVTVSIPILINDDISKYNLSSEYYNDICSKTTSESGTDIILKDRKNEFIKNNKSLCEEDCDLVDYDYEAKKSKCSCLTKINLPFLDSIIFDKNKLLKHFTDIKNIVNLNIMKCYKNAFDKKTIKNNYGFFIVLFIKLLYFVCLIIFIFQSFNKLKYIIKNITFMLKVTKKNKEVNQISLRKKIINLDVISFKQLNTIYAEHVINRFKLENNNKIDKSKTIILGTENELNNNENNIIHKDFELNSLNYEEALKLDKRTYLKYYFSLLKINHLLLFSFFTENDYNSKIIKMFLFFFLFDLNLTVNALFFNDDTMHKIYEDEGNYNFVYQLPQIIYSSLLSKLINYIIKFLSLTQDKIVEIKQEKIKKGLDERIKKLITTLKFKFIIFFVLTFILLTFSLYYISCFCGIYINTQTHLIKDTIFSFIISLIYPFALYLIPGIFRICALKRKKSCLYKFSKLLQLI